MRNLLFKMKIWVVIGKLVDKDYLGIFCGSSNKETSSYGKNAGTDLAS